MIGLLIAQQAAAALGSYSGPAPTYEAVCRVVLFDRSRQEVSFVVDGVGRDRRVSIEVDGEKSIRGVALDAYGIDGEGRTMVDEKIIIGEGNVATFLYRLQYAMPGPAPVERIGVLRFNEAQLGTFYGTGLCWIKRGGQ